MIGLFISFQVNYIHEQELICADQRILPGSVSPPASAVTRRLVLISVDV